MGRVVCEKVFRKKASWLNKLLKIYTFIVKLFHDSTCMGVCARVFICVCVPCMGLQHFCISVKLLDYCTSTSWCGISRATSACADARHHAVAEMQKAVFYQHCTLQ